jgi:hypothetical protein
MRVILALLMIVHGIAHLPGFLVPWRLMKPQGMSYRTTLLGGRLELGDAGIRGMGVLWLLIALAFVGVGIAALLRSPSWVGLALAVSAVSLVLSILALPDSRIGIVVNVALLAVLAIGGGLGWFAIDR